SSLEQVWVVPLQPDDLLPLAGGAEEAGTLGRHGETGLLDDLRAAVAVVAPLHERVPVREVVLIQPLLGADLCPFLAGWLLPGKAVFLPGIQPDCLDDMGVGPPLLAGLEPDGPDDSPAPADYFRRRVGSEDEPVLRGAFVLERARFPPVG